MTRLRIVAENIPPVLGLLDADLEIEYQSIQISRSEALLPRRADIVLTQFSGTKSRNVVSFSGCRKFGSESVVSLKPPMDPPAAKPPRP
jgi:hypothetical protein